MPTVWPREVLTAPRAPIPAVGDWKNISAMTGRVHDVDEDRLIEQDRPDDRDLDQARDRSVAIAVDVSGHLSVAADRPYKGPSAGRFSTARR